MGNKPVKIDGNNAFEDCDVLNHLLRAYAANAEASTLNSDELSWVFNKGMVKSLRANDVDLKCFVETQENVQWLAVESPSHVMNHLVNSDLTWYPDAGIFVMEGIKRISEGLLKTVEPYLDSKKKLCACGHGIGGAAAVIVAHSLQLKGFEVKSVVTFGQPKVTDEKGVSKLEKNLGKYLRVRLLEDDLAILPPTSLALEQNCMSSHSYIHSGAELVTASSGVTSFSEAYTGDEIKSEVAWGTKFMIDEDRSELSVRQYMSSMKNLVSRHEVTRAEKLSALFGLK